MYAIRHIPGARNIITDFFSRYVLLQDPQMPTTLAAIIASLFFDTDSEEGDPPLLVPLALPTQYGVISGRTTQVAVPNTDVITDILHECAIDTDPEALITALQSKDDEPATLAAVGMARTPEEALDLVHKSRTGHKGGKRYGFR